MSEWWLSFADDTTFRGCVIIEAPSFEGAFLLVSGLGLNPGGECIGTEVTPDRLASAPADQREAFARLPRGVLLMRADLDRAKMAVEKVET